jgi:DNA-binding transcriptional regulator YdaS (Cro superfamily)
MTPQIFRKKLRQLKLSQAGASRLLDISPRQLKRWIAGDAEIPTQTAMLITLMSSGNWSPNAARVLAGYKPIDNLNRKAGRPKKEKS